MIELLLRALTVFTFRPSSDSSSCIAKTCSELNQRGAKLAPVLIPSVLSGGSIHRAQANSCPGFCPKPIDRIHFWFLLPSISTQKTAKRDVLNRELLRQDRNG